MQYNIIFNPEMTFSSLIADGLVFHVPHSVSVDGEDGLALRKTGTVVDLTNSLLSSPLPQIQPAYEMVKMVFRSGGLSRPCGGGVGHDVPSNGLLGVRVEHSSPVHLGHHLVGHHYGNSELVRELQEGPEELGEVHLPGGELPAATVVRPVAGSGAVHHHHGVPGLRHHGSGLGQQGHLVVAVVSPGVGHVVQDVTALQSVPLGNCQQPEQNIVAKCCELCGTMLFSPLGSECPLSINVETFALGAPVVDRQLTCDSYGVTELRLPSPTVSYQSDQNS